LEALLIESLNAYIRYHDLPGDEPALVFIHGLGSASSSWFPRILRYSCIATRRAVLVDLLGFGFSDRSSGFGYEVEEHADTVTRVLEHLCLEDCIVIGHSMGGAIVINLASRYPDLVANLIVAEANLDPGPGIVSGPTCAQSEEEYVKSGYTEFIRILASKGWADYAGTVQASDPIAMYRSAASLIRERKPTFREQLLSLRTPRTFIFGRRTLPSPDVAALSAQGINVRIVEDSGHDMMSDNPDGFAEAIAGAIS